MGITARDRNGDDRDTGQRLVDRPGIRAAPSGLAELVGDIFSIPCLGQQTRQARV